MKKGKDESTVINETTLKFENDWKDLDYRLSVISGKTFFSMLNEYLQLTFGISITYSQVANYINDKDLTSEIKNFFSELQTFRKGS